jgi:hypothetical protein
MLRILLIRKTGGKLNFLLAGLRQPSPFLRAPFLDLHLDYFRNLSLL